MSSKIYRYTESHMRSTRRAAVTQAFIPALIFAVALVVCLLTKQWLAVAGFLAVGLIVTFQGYRRTREAIEQVRQMQKMSIELAPDVLRFSGPDGVAEVKLETVVSMQVARRNGTVRAVCIKLPSTDVLTVVGIERLEEFTTSLSRLLGQSKVREFRWWQSHPA